MLEDETGEEEFNSTFNDSDVSHVHDNRANCSFAVATPVNGKRRQPIMLDTSESDEGAMKKPRYNGIKVVANDLLLPW